MDLREIGWDGMDWIAMAVVMDQWIVPVSTIINIQVPKNAGKFLSSCTQVASQEGLYSMKLVS
jgi:hypothetical protein